MDGCSIDFQSRRSAIYGRHGMVASSQPLASSIGLEILRQQGNAVDAAIAMAAALNVTEPCSTGIGGDMFLLYYHAATKTVHALNGSGRAPAQLTLQQVLTDCPRAKEEGRIPFSHAHAVSVPGTVAGWVDAIEKWGTMSMAQVLDPARRLAEEGFPVSPITAYQWNRCAPQLESGGNGPELLIHGRAPREGEVFRNPGLANCFKLISEQGKQGFYGGIVAERIIQEIHSHGGVMSAEDLQAHVSTYPEAIKVSFGGIDVYEVPPNGQGITALIALNILSKFFTVPETGEPKKDIPEHNSAEYLHKVIEALRLAFADAKWYVTDPEFCNVPIEELLSEAYAKDRASQIDPLKSMPEALRGTPALSSNTVSFQVVDQNGNAVSMVNSNYDGFGTGLIPRGCGFTLQNRACNFSLEEGHPNVLAPRKRPYHTIIAGMSLKNGELHSTFTVMGGFMQPQGHVQILLNLLIYRMNSQQALDAPRICIGALGEVNVEEGIAEEVLKELNKKGHDIVRVRGHDRSVFGRGQIIVHDPVSKVLCGGSDGRADGCAIGW